LAGFVNNGLNWLNRLNWLNLNIRENIPLENPYLPYPVRIDDIIVETEDSNLKTFRLVFLNPEDEKKFAYTPGQFAELSIAGKGEAIGQLVSLG